MTRYDPRPLRDRLNQVMKERGLNNHKWAKIAGLPESTFRNFMAGVKDNITTKTLTILAEGIGLTLEELLCPGSTDIVKIGIYGTLPSHQPQELPDGVIMWPGRERKLIAYRMEGNAMNRIAPDGSVIIIDTDQCDPLSLVNKPVIVRLNGSRMFKVLRGNPTRFEPDSTEKGYDTIYLQPGQEWSIIGRVVGVMNNLEE